MVVPAVTLAVEVNPPPLVVGDSKSSSPPVVGQPSRGPARGSRGRGGRNSRDPAAADVDVGGGSTVTVPLVNTEEVNRVTVGVSFTEAQLEQVNQLHPGFVFRSQAGKPYHGHAILRAERHIAAALAWELARKGSGGVSAVNIGGGNRLETGKFAHTIAPILSPADAVTHKDGPSVCRHTLQTCNCVTGPCVAVMAHVLYYLSPKDLLEQMCRLDIRRLAATVHRFPNFSGKLYDEAYYTHVGPDRVQMSVRGGDTFTHGDLSWLSNSGSFVGTRLGGLLDPVSLCWNLKRSIGTTDVFEFVVVPGVIEPSPFEPHTFDNPGVKSVGTLQVSASLRLRVGTSAVWTDDADPVPVPKGLISHLSVKAAGKVRDQSTLRDLTRDARGWIRDKKPVDSGFPEDRLAAAVSAAVRTAMIINLERERRDLLLLHGMAPALAEFNELVTSQFDDSKAGVWRVAPAAMLGDCFKRIRTSLMPQRQFVAHEPAQSAVLSPTDAPLIVKRAPVATGLELNARLTFGKLRWFLLFMLGALVLCRLPTASAAPGPLTKSFPLPLPSVYAPLGHTQVDLTEVWIGALYSGWLNAALVFCTSVAVWRFGAPARLFGFGTLFVNFGTATAAGFQVSGSAIALPGLWDLAAVFVCLIVLRTVVRKGFEARRYCVYRTDSVLVPGPTTATFEPDPYHDHETDPKPFVYAHAPVLANFYPTANSNSVANERVAIHNRAAPATVGKHFDETQWRNFASWVRMMFPIIFRAKKLRPVDFEKWVSRYTPAQQAKLRAAHDELQSGVKDKKVLHINYFLKGELSFGKIDEEGRNKSKPRVISSGSSYYNVIIGPTITAIQGWVGKPGNRHKDVLMCESGRRAIGKFMERQSDAPFVGENDYEAFDATQHVACRMLIIEMLVEHFGMAPEVARLMRAAAKEKFGHTLNGTFVSMEGTMASGHPDTYLTNTMMNILLQWYASACCGVFKPPIAAAGDDSVIFLPKAIDTALFNSTIARLGLSCNLVQYPNDPEVHQIGYCSSIIMPRADGWFLAPAPGRMFAKLPFIRAHVPGPLSALRGNLLAAWPSASRLPFVREYFQWVLQNTEHVPATMPFDPHALQETVAVCGHWQDVPHDPATLALFRARYDLDDRDLVAFKRRLSEHRYGDAWTDAAVQRIADVDLAISEDIQNAATERVFPKTPLGAGETLPAPSQRRAEVVPSLKKTALRLFLVLLVLVAFSWLMASAAASNESHSASSRASARKPKVVVPRKELAKAVRAAAHRAPARLERARVRLDASTEAANAYVAGLLDPFGKGRNIRRPDDGIFPTAVIGSTARFEAALAINSTVGNKQALWAYEFLPDLHYSYRRLVSFVASGPLSWGSYVASAAWSTVSTQGTAFRGACNVGIRVRFSSAAVARGGKFIVAMVPPGGADGIGGPPSSLDQIYTAPLTAVLDIEEYSRNEPGVVCWLPAGGDAPFLIGSGSPSGALRTGSSWTSTGNPDAVYGDSSIVIAGYTNIGYDGTAPVVGAVDLQATIEWVINSEFIPAFGGNQNVFPMKLVNGSEADVNKVMKPVEARFDGNALASMVDGTFGTLATAADQVGGSMMKGPGGQAAGLAMHGASQWMRMGSELLRGNYKQAGINAAEAALSVIPMFLMKQHIIAAALGVPYVGPSCWYGARAPRGRRFTCPPKPLTDEEFLKLVLDAVHERTRLPPDPYRFDAPPLGSRYGPEPGDDAASTVSVTTNTPQPERKDASGWYSIDRARP